jgi:hypothetical protein
MTAHTGVPLQAFLPMTFLLGGGTDRRYGITE